MYINELAIQGYKNFGEETVVNFNEGLNVLVGENGTGKSSIIDAIRLLLAEDEYGRAGIRDTDFHLPFVEDAVVADHIQVRATFFGIEEEEKVAFLPWMVSEDHARLTLRIENKPNSLWRYKRVLWGGVSKDSMFEPDLFDSVSCIYLPPLRDAEAKLRSGRNSRLARLLYNMNKEKIEVAREEEGLHPLEQKVKDFNESLVADKGGDETISEVDGLIQKRFTEAVGQVFSQDTSIRFSEVRFRRIVEGLHLLFFPKLGEATNPDLYRSLEENSLGYNNILYLATVLAELTSEKVDNEYLKVLLIEEPEAHLHPQLQIKLLGYLEEQAQNRGIQILVTTHSPVLASSASLDTLIHLTKIDKEITATQIKHCGLSDNSPEFLARWMDVTKSTLLFARGIIFVEGIAEAMLISELAHRVLKKYNQGLEDDDEKLPEDSLANAGVTIINMGGIYFKHFLPLFCNLTDNPTVVSVPVRCAGITDRDPLKDSKPTPGNRLLGNNPAIKLATKVNSSPNCRIFISPLKTFEYDLAMQGENLKVMLQFKKSIPNDLDLRQKMDTYGSDEEWSEAVKINEAAKGDVSNYLLSTIDKGEFSQSLADKLHAEPELAFDVPNYIRDAVLWVVGGIDA